MMMSVVLFAIGVIASATVFALLEIQIEGANGWAERLPTWRIHNRFTRLFYGGRPLTGYHFYALLFIAVLSHVPFLIGVAPWTAAAELRVAAFVILFFIVEDFLWFVLNPAYGLKRFRRESVWWHARAWWWVMPREYWVGIPVAALCYWLAGMT
jgi:hypothetical protein